MTVDRTRNDLERFRWTCPAWWDAFNRGRERERRDAQNERADWKAADWQRGAAERIREDAA